MFIIFVVMFFAEKNKLVFKIVFGLPVLIFFDYLIIVILGCASCLFGFGDSYYCGTYCYIGKCLILISLLLFGWYLYPDLKKKLRSNIHK